MIKYFGKRLLSALGTLFILSIIIFSITHLTPGDPARIMLGADAEQEAVDNLNAELGLNDPLIAQYVSWVWDVAHGDLGISYSRKGAVMHEISTAMEPTFTLAIWGQVLSILLAIPLGVFAARKKGKIADSSVIAGSLIGISVPSFLLSLLLAMLFSVKLGWLPVAGYKALENNDLVTHLKYLVLPVISLSLMQAAMLTRMTRASMIDVINNDYIKSAKAKGLKQSVILFKHALKNAMIPILTTIGQTFATLLSGAAVVETVFNIPGIGQLIVSSVSKRDYPMIQGIVLVISLIYIVINLSIDIIYGYIDPRVRVTKGTK